MNHRLMLIASLLALSASAGNAQIILTSAPFRLFERPRHSWRLQFCVCSA